MVNYEAFERQVVFETGMILAYTSLLTYQMSCEFDVSQFPYDSQTCEITATMFASRPDDYELGLQNEIKRNL